MSLIIGIDPDSKAHGVAVYKNGKLVELLNMPLMDIEHRFLIPKLDCFFAIEHVSINKPIFAGTHKLNIRAHGKKGQNVGMCKQAQVELVRALDYHRARYCLIKPMAGNWGTSKTSAETKLKTEQFKKETGWKCRSNSDTRSAAFFGCVAIRRLSRELPDDLV